MVFQPPLNARFTAPILREAQGEKSLMTTHDYLEAELAAHDKFPLENSGSASFFGRC